MAAADRRGALGLICGGIALGLPVTRLAAVTVEPQAWGNLEVEIVAARFSQGGWLRGRLIRPERISTLRLGDQPVIPDPQGRFLIGFDRDCASVVHLRAACAVPGACPSSQDQPEFGMRIAPRAWKIEHVDAPLRPPAVPDAEYLRRRKEELARIAAARAVVTDAQGWQQAMTRPAPGRISGRFGAQRVYQGQPGAYHSGLDLAAVTGTPILAPADGVVVLATTAPFTLEGRLLMVDHGMGLSSAFLHCSAHLVTEGETVRQGQPIARVGMTGRASGPHLHWGLKWRDSRLDPLLFLEGAE